MIKNFIQAGIVLLLLAAGLNACRKKTDNDKLEVSFTIDAMTSTAPMLVLLKIRRLELQ